MDFITAVTKNDIEKVRGLLQTGVEVNSPVLWNSKNTYSPVIPTDKVNRSDLLNNDQEYQCKALNIAVLGGHADMTRLLLSAGADINSKDGRGRTALVCAIYGLDLDASNINTSNLDLISQTNSQHFEIMKNIIMCHPNLYYATLDSPQYEIKGITPLCLTSYLGKTDIIQLLLDDGRVNVDGTDSKNATALMYASRDGTVPVVKMLLRYNASPDITDSHGWSAIQYAERNPEIVQLCEQVLRIKRSEYTGNDDIVLKYPINYTKLSHLINTMPNYSSSLSHLQFDTLHDLDLLDPAAQPLVQIIQSAFLQAIKIHDHLSLQTLLLKPPSLNAHQTRQGPPLLMNHHDPKTGLTPFHHAMRTKPLPSLETIKLLYHAGADINAQTYYGRTALHHLARFGLDSEGSWGIQKSNQGSVPMDADVPQHLAHCASLLIRLGALVNMADPTGNTPLHFAAEFGGIAQVIQVLILEGGADITLKNKKGASPLDVCKSKELQEKMIALDQERKTMRSRSIYSLSGTIRPFDSASEYNRTSILMPTWETDEGSDFEVILKSFFNYQTSFTDSIETSLAFLTDSVVGQWTMKDAATIQQLEKTTLGLRLELREAHEMFDATDQRVEKVMMAFREELEEVEQVHQADWEMSELQHDKIEKLFDVFERIEGRYCQLEQAQEDLVKRIEKLRKVAGKKRSHGQDDLGGAIVHLSQTLFILQILPSDPALHVRDDKARLHQDLHSVFSQVSRDIATYLGQSKDEAKSALVREAQQVLEKRWSLVSEQLSNDAEIPVPSPVWQPPAQPKRKQLDSSQLFSLNQLELSFDILHSNLFEIQRDIQDITEQSEKIAANKKKLYDLCLSLEKELTAPERSELEIKTEISQVLYWTQQLFNKKHALDLEKSQLLKEHKQMEKQLEETRGSLKMVRPPVLLQGLLERLDTDDTCLSSTIKIEKDWKEDTNLVMEFAAVEQDSDTDSDGVPHDLTALELKQLDTQCTSPLSSLSFLARLDASLYSLKVLTHKYITRSRQHLLDVQAILAQASTELEDTRHRMTQLYDDAAEVARQVFALKTELETIVRHRKEEVVKVWEVVDEVSESVKAKIAQCQKTHTSQEVKQSPAKEEDQDRHQWIIRELEQLQHAYESLQVAINELKQEQAMIGQNLKQLASQLIEPQVNCLVGQEPTSLLSVSDQLTELIDRIRKDDLGLRPISFWSQQFKLEDTPMAQVNHRLSCISAANQRLPSSSSGRSLYSKPSPVRTDKKRMSVISATSLSSLSSYQQERMMSKASNLSQALSKAKQQDIAL
ncbi:hypothetical protein CU098_010454 [Rhizopus stolonifer]|uniref:Uncharacterized protein n=1 Tax=Rhizopus stolonifer TaxID=4846 RepID=A0A367KNV3_RHIST|nr:hypothetical protein CU098_010454 [Rhizopus stolonifer]